jgi:hypothetical protein
VELQVLFIKEHGEQHRVNIFTSSTLPSFMFVLLLFCLVAVKQVATESMTEDDKLAFKAEIDLMKKLRHHGKIFIRCVHLRSDDDVVFFL